MIPLFADETKKIIECLLFVASEPISLKRIAELAECDTETALAILASLSAEYQDRGFVLRSVGGGWQFAARAEFATYIKKYYNPKAQQLSKASLETLAIIAYRQPLTRGDIEKIRQVKADSICYNLLEKGLIAEVGRREGPGKPILFGTTEKFLQSFGLNDLSELPPLSADTDNANNAFAANFSGVELTPEPENEL